jgi:hypothetical protein
MARGVSSAIFRMRGLCGGIDSKFELVKQFVDSAEFVVAEKLVGQLCGDGSLLRTTALACPKNATLFSCFPT